MGYKSRQPAYSKQRRRFESVSSRGIQDVDCSCGYLPRGVEPSCLTIHVSKLYGTATCRLALGRRIHDERYKDVPAPFVTDIVCW